MTRTQEAALQYGCNTEGWPEVEQRHAAAEMFQRDERVEYPSWIGDALCELLAMAPHRRLEIIRLMGEDDTARRLYGLGALLDDALRRYPADAIGALCGLHLADWRAGERLSEYRLDADSREKAERECAA